MSVTEETPSLREQAREYLHKVAYHDDTNYGNVFVIDGARIDGETALDMAELALLTQKPIAASYPGVSVAQVLELAHRLAALEECVNRLSAHPALRQNISTTKRAAKGDDGEGPSA